MPNSPNRLAMQWTLWKWNWSPHDKWGKKDVGALKGLMGNLKRLNLQISQKPTWKLHWKNQIGAKRLMRGGRIIK